MVGSERVVPWLQAALAGLLWGLAPPGVPGAIVTLCGAVAAAGSVRGWPLGDAGRGLLLGALWYGTALAWAPLAWSRFAGEGGAAVLGVTVLLHAPVPAAAWLLAGLGRRSGVAAPIALGAGVAVAEGTATVLLPLPLGASFGLVGASALLWPAALGGRVLLSSLLLAWGAAVRVAPGRALATLAAVGAIGAAWTALPQEGTLEVAVVEPGTGAFDMRRASTASERAERLLALVEAAERGGASLVVTPEGAWPEDPGDGEGHRHDRFEARWAGRGPVLVGATVGRPPHARNEVIAVDGRVTARMAKRHLVPLAERAVLGLGRAHFAPGEGGRVLEVAGVRAGVLVCYEDLLPGALREVVWQGAEVLVAATNDAWLGSWGAERHLAAARLAAVETRRWVLRPTPSGRSAVLDPRGRAHGTTRWRDADTEASPGAVVTGRVRPRRALAPAPFAPPLLVLLGLLLLRRRRPR